MGGGEGIRAAGLDLIQLDITASMEDAQNRDLATADPKHDRSLPIEADRAHIVFRTHHCAAVWEKRETKAIVDDFIDIRVSYRPAGSGHQVPNNLGNIRLRPI